MPATEADTALVDADDEAADVVEAGVVGAWVAEVAGAEAGVGVVEAGLLALLPPQAPSRVATATADTMVALSLKDGIGTRSISRRFAA
jgi:hypothetical protein